jgi:N-acetylmuramoyl-L-alanine amidase
VRSDVKGVETYCLTPAGAPSTNAGHDLTGAGLKTGNRNNDKNMFLAYEVQKSLVKGLGLEDRGLRRARFAVLSGAEMPAVLIEGGFMSHPTESRRIYDPVFRQKMAKTIVDGIAAYAKQVER